MSTSTYGIDHSAFRHAQEIPEQLVKVEYVIPPTPSTQTTYFEDREDKDKDFYDKALSQVFPGAVMFSFTRGVKPEPSSSKGGCW